MTPDERTAANRQNRAIVQHLVSCRDTGKPYCTTKELFECFGPEIPDDDDFRSFQKKLTYLSGKNAIQNVAVSGKTAHWVPGPNADAYCLPPGDRAEVKTKPKPVLWEGLIVPPRRVDVMNGPTYVPTRAASTRAGADDFRNCPSVGVRC